MIDLESYYRTYFKQMNEGIALDNDAPFNRFSSYLLDSLERIKKRLGGERYQKVAKQMQGALKKQKDSGDIELHRIWIESLLTSYYDPMYEYQLEHKQQRFIFRGNSYQILANQKKILDLD